MSESVDSIVTVKAGKDKQLIRHHPWVFSGAIEPDSTLLQSLKETVVRVKNSYGQFIAYGWYDPESHIPLRLLSWEEHIVPDSQWWIDTTIKSVKRRFEYFGTVQKSTNAFRLVHGEADFLPGFAIDLYGQAIVVIISARVAWAHRHVIITTLQKLLNPELIIVQTDTGFTRSEKIPDTTEYYSKGNEVSALPNNEPIMFTEHGLFYSFEAGKGQKSGHFCDQRENRMKMAMYAKDKRMLDLFCYTGGFTLQALRKGCNMIDAVDSSGAALDRLASNIQLNIRKGKIHCNSDKLVTFHQADAFEFLREVACDTYDIIVLDPPKLAKTKSQVEGAQRAYKDINRLAFEKVKTGGLVATFSCSGSVSREQFKTILSWAAKDSGKEIQIIESFSQPLDHPIRLSFPESEYLKGYLLKVL